MEDLRKLKRAKVAIDLINQALVRTEGEMSKIKTSKQLKTMARDVTTGTGQWWMVASYEDKDYLNIIRKGTDEEMKKMPTMLLYINPPTSKQSNLMRLYVREAGRKTTVYREKTEVPSKDDFERENMYSVEAPASDKSDDEVKFVAVEPAKNQNGDLTEDDDDKDSATIPKAPPPTPRVKQTAKLVDGCRTGTPAKMSALCGKAANSATPEPLQAALGEPFSFGQKLSNEPCSFGRNSSDTKMEDARRFAGVGGSQPCGSGWGGPLLDTKPPVKRVVIDMTKDPITPEPVLGKRPREDGVYATNEQKTAPVPAEKKQKEMSFEEKLQATRAEMQQNLAEMRKRWAAAGLEPKKA